MTDRPASRFTIADVRQRAYKRRDAWWTVFLVDPVASRLVLVTANRTNLTPNQLTVASLVFGFGAAAAFYGASYAWLAVGAGLYHVSFILDCIDGKIARLKGTGSIFGRWLDYIFDRLRVLSCSLALMAGQFRVTGDEAFLYLAYAVIFLDMLRYMDALQVGKLRREMRDRLLQAKIERGISVEQETQEVGEDEEAVWTPPTGADLQREFVARFGWYLGVREWLKRWRVRAHLFSGIEYQMFVFIVGPLTGYVKGTVIVSSILLFVFETAIIYKLWLSARDFGRELAGIEALPIPDPQGTAVYPDRAQG